MGQVWLNSHEKNAIITLQSVLNARERVSREKMRRLTYFLKKLPPYRALLVYGHALNAISERMDEGDKYKEPLKRMGKTITETMGPDYADLIENDPGFYDSQRDILSQNLFKIGNLMQTIAEERRVA